MASLIVAGSTGAIGRAVVQQAAQQPTIARIIALTRSTQTGPEHFAKLFGVHKKDSNTGAESGTESGAVGKNESWLTEAEISKIVPVTFDWDEFLANWQSLRAEFSKKKKDDTSVSEVNEAMKKQLEAWKGTFAGHTYCAMCLGTTRGDAGSAENFIKCDYSYVVAFTEAVLLFSGPVGFSFEGAAAEDVSSKSSSSSKHKRSSTPLFLHALNGKTDPVKTSDSAVFDTSSSAAYAQALWETAYTTATLQRFVQISAYNANKTSFILYSKTKGAADAAVAERVVLQNEKLLNASSLSSTAGEETTEATSAKKPCVSLSFVMPGLLERYDKTRGTEKWAKYIMSAIGVDCCGQCAVANMMFDDKHFKNKLDESGKSEEDAYFLNYASSSSDGKGKRTNAKRNEFAFDCGKYWQAVVERQQVAANGNKLLYFWQGNGEIKKQAERIAGAAK